MLRMLLDRLMLMLLACAIVFTIAHRVKPPEAMIEDTTLTHSAAPCPALNQPPLLKPRRKVNGRAPVSELA